MLSVVKSMCLYGLEGQLIDVEVDVSSGIPAWDIVGLPDTSIKEAKERVRTAIKNCGIELKSRKYIINLSPSNLHKNGPIFDLPIAVGILSSIQVIRPLNFKEILFIGELSLDGRLKSVNGVLSICLSAKKYGISKIILPQENSKEAGVVDNIDIIGVRCLKEVIEYLNGNMNILKEEKQNFIEETTKENLDFSEVKGQEFVKRGLEIAAAGAHNVCLIGSPGSGKTMLAERMPSIMPNLTFEEALEITQIYSLIGKNKNEGLIKKRPFRRPHHSITEKALIGGGRIPKPGEISLAHLGILYLDEFLEFNKALIDILRIPMEDKKVQISRNGITCIFPCNFMTIASMNPCQCGYFGSNKKECTCTPLQRKQYISKLSGPIKDRFDIKISVFPVEISKVKKEKNETSETIKNRVNKARKIQLKRYKNDNIFSNSDLTPKLIEKYCKIDKEAEMLIKNSFEKFDLSMRGYYKILKLARTIADLSGENNIEKIHIIEAIQYRGDINF